MFDSVWPHGPQPTRLFSPWDFPGKCTGVGCQCLLLCLCLHVVNCFHCCVAGFPGGINGKEPACQCRRLKRCGLNPRVGKIPWRREWQLAPVFLPEESHGQRSLEGYSPSGCSQTRLKLLSTPIHTSCCVAIMLYKIANYRRTNIAWFHLHEVFKTVKLVEVKNRMVIQEPRGERNRGLIV